MSKHNLTDLEFKRDSLVSQLRAINTAIEEEKTKEVKLDEAIKAYIKDISYRSISYCPFSKSVTRGLEGEFNEICDFVRSNLSSITILDAKTIVNIEARGTHLSSTCFAMLEAYMTLLSHNFDGNFLMNFS